MSNPKEKQPPTPTPTGVLPESSLPPEPATAESPPPAAAAPAESAPVLDQQAEMTRLQAELAAANDRVLRAHAELENFRKRVYRQMDDERKYAALPLLRDLVPVVDNLDRAIDAGTSSNGPGLLEGVRIVAQQLQAALARHHCQRLVAEGAVFDPHVHEAIAQHPSNTHPAGTVMAVTQVGYLLHDRVVRPAQVLVSAGPAATTPPVTACTSHPADPA